MLFSVSLTLKVLLFSLISLQMGKYFTAYRIDHILGFFRIWELPDHAMTGLIGKFRPSIPLSQVIPWNMQGVHWYITLKGSNFALDVTVNNSSASGRTWKRGYMGLWSLDSPICSKRIFAGEECVSRWFKLAFSVRMLTCLHM